MPPDEFDDWLAWFKIKKEEHDKQLEKAKQDQRANQSRARRPRR